MTELIKVVVSRVEDPQARRLSPTIEVIEYSTDGIHTVISGLYSAIPFPGMRNVFLFYDDIGKIKKLAPNIFIPFDFIAGDLLVAGADGEDLIDLTEEQVKEIVAYINYHRVM